MEITCPSCQSGSIVEKEKVFSCSAQSYNQETKTNEGCDFVIWKNMFGTTLTYEDIAKLAEGEAVTKNCVSKAGKDYEGILSLDMETFKINLSFPERKEDEVDENGISEFSKGYKKDNKVVWKTISGQNITKDEALQLFNGESIRKENMVSQAGNEFSANLFLNEEGKIEMVFDN